MGIEYMMHVGICVRDLQRSIRFYRDGLGFVEQGRLDISGESIAEAVSHIRAEKLPDPSRVPNVGSFFKNPVLEAERAEAVAKAFPDLVQFDVAGGKKLSAAWLIDQMGLKGYRVGRFVVSDKHALVIINEGDGTQLELFELVGVVKQKVKHTFGIDLEIEPRIYPDGFDVSY